MDYTVHILEDEFIFFSNPKVACTTLKVNLNSLAMKADLDIDFKYRQEFDIHRREHNILSSPSQVGFTRFLEMLTDPKIFKFCFVREPVSRLISAYGNKIFTNNPIGRGLVKRLKLRPGHKMSFELFVEVLQDEHILYSNEHWRPQVDQLCCNRVDYSFMGDFDRFDAHFDRVVSELFPQFSWSSYVHSSRFIDPRLLNPASLEEKNKKASLNELICADMRRKIEKIYERDVELYQKVSAR